MIHIEMFACIHYILVVCVFQAVMADTQTGAVLDTSQQLDLLIVEYFQSLSEIFKYKQLLENDIKDGFFHMAKVTPVIYTYY